MQHPIKINILKFEVVNGKKTAKSYSFPMDPKKMARYQTEATVRKKIEEYIVKNRMFKKEELKDLRYDMKEFLEAWKKAVGAAKTELLQSLDAAQNQPETRVTPETIDRLGANEVFVFGSNAAGRHYGGAARVAVNKFGAIMGQGHGMQGKSYAIDSMSGIPNMEKDITDFCAYAQEHPEKHFLVTRIGCGIAGYKDEEIAPSLPAVRTSRMFHYLPPSGKLSVRLPLKKSTTSTASLKHRNATTPPPSRKCRKAER